MSSVGWTDVPAAGATCADSGDGQPCRALAKEIRISDSRVSGCGLKHHRLLCVSGARTVRSAYVTCLTV